MVSSGSTYDCAKVKSTSARILCTDPAGPYVSNELRDELEQRGTKSVIPNRSNRRRRFTFSKRPSISCVTCGEAFNRLKDLRRIATRYDKLALNYLASDLMSLDTS